MEIYRSLDAYRSSDRLVVTIGTYDGVHYGHRVLLSRIQTLAQKSGMKSALVTFEPHPRIALNKDVDKLRLLSSTDEKINLLEEANLDKLFILPFGEAFSRLSAEEFVREVLVNSLHAGIVVIGHDHRFGHDRQGDIHFLSARAEQYGYQVEEIPRQQLTNWEVSSTQIRQHLQAGELEKANQLLTKPYLIRGEVVKGDQIGRTIGFPTANLALPNAYKLLPPEGIYAVKAGLYDATIPAMLYIGKRPSLAGKTELRVEVNLLDFNEDLYGKTLNVRLYSFIRPDQKFESLEALTQALKQDEQATRAFFSKQIEA